MSRLHPFLILSFGTICQICLFLWSFLVGSSVIDWNQRQRPQCYLSLVLIIIPLFPPVGYHHYIHSAFHVESPNQGTIFMAGVWTCFNQTWTRKGQPCGLILRKGFDTPCEEIVCFQWLGALFPPHEVEKLSLPSHQENLNWLDRNDRNCLQSQTSFIQLVVSRGFYAF
mgnify:CR=1 FL=1